jgi:hypothetical protein
LSAAAGVGRARNESGEGMMNKNGDLVKVIDIVFVIIMGIFIIVAIIDKSHVIGNNALKFFLPIVVILFLINFLYILFLKQLNEHNIVNVGISMGVSLFSLLSTLRLIIIKFFPNVLSILILSVVFIIPMFVLVIIYRLKLGKKQFEWMISYRVTDLK